ncbi:MAG: hypothetical protein DMF79_06820 [Acidobacteria bacterium]|nr:MAG: hypothetical protein DMF79_06820 [Acidobacteriota bacterium]
MMSMHLTDDKLMEVMEDAADADARAHVESCAACASRVREARDGHALAREAGVPEPSPLYWEAFRRNLGQRIEDEGAAWGWRWALVPILATAAALAVLVPAVHRPLATSPSPNPVLAAWSALPPADQDDGLEVLEGVALADADLPVVDGERNAVESLADLSDEEARDVGDALRSGLSGVVL